MQNRRPTEPSSGETQFTCLLRAAKLKGVTPTNSSSNVKKPRRWLQFSLRSLLILMFAVCGATGAWKWHRYPYEEQRRALDALASNANFETTPAYPVWLHGVLDPEFYHHVPKVSYFQPAVDDDLAPLRKLHGVKHLSLAHTNISDAGLAHVGRLAELKELSLWKTNVTSQGLPKLRGLASLKALQLTDTKVDGPGLAHLAAMQNLEVLGLGGLPIQDEHLAPLERLAALKVLDLEEMPGRNWLVSSRGAALAPTPPVRLAQTLYKSLTPLYDAVCGPSLHAGRRRAMALLDPRPGERILEVGVGTGYGVNDYPRDCKVTAIDLSREMIDRAARRVDEAHRGLIAFAQMDAANLALPDEAFDAVYVPYTINVVPDPIAVGRELLRVCGPAGRVVFLNHFDGVPETSNLINGLVGRIASALDVNWHLHIETFAAALNVRVAAIESVNKPCLSSVVLCERAG